MNAEDQTISKALDILGTGPAAQEVYRDLLQPAAREMGANLLTIAKVVTAAMLPLRGAVWGWERIEAWLSVTLTEKLATKDPDDVQVPPMSVAGPILLQLPFCETEELLRDMYASLLATAMDRSAEFPAHPAFVYVVQQLSSDEALLLKHIAPTYTGSETLFTETDEGFYLPSQEGIDTKFHDFCKNINLTCPENSGAYLDNLLRLKLFAERYYGEVTYEPEHAHRYGVEPASVNRHDTREIYLTEFGKGFITACVI